MDATQLLAGPFGDELHKLVVHHMTFTLFGIEDSSQAPEIKNGTCFFVRSPLKVFAVTARHVIDSFKELRQSDTRAVFQIGNLRLDPEPRLLGIGVGPDIATIEILDPELAKLEKIPISLWPPEPPHRDDAGVLLAGYPAGSAVRDSGRVVSFGIYASTAVAQRVTDHQISCTIEWDRVIPSATLGGLPPRNYDVGGMSGGPVLTIRERKGFLSFPIAGVISEGRAAEDKIVAELGDSIRADGSIRG